MAEYAPAGILPVPAATIHPDPGVESLLALHLRHRENRRAAGTQGLGLRRVYLSRFARCVAGSLGEQSRETWRLRTDEQPSTRQSGRRRDRGPNYRRAFG